jgi:hypothetical protein
VKLTPYFITEFEMIFKGSDAAERKDIYYVISDVDHPATTLLQSPNKLNKGMAAKIGLSLKKVRGRPSINDVRFFLNIFATFPLS